MNNPFNPFDDEVRPVSIGEEAQQLGGLAVMMAKAFLDFDATPKEKEAAAVLANAYLRWRKDNETVDIMDAIKKLDRMLKL